MASKVEKLRDLTTKRATADHQEEFNKQISDEADDRSFCLLLTSMLENALDQALDHWIGDQTKELRQASTPRTAYWPPSPARSPLRSSSISPVPYPVRTFG
jgi:hypothetical protein